MTNGRKYYFDLHLHTSRYSACSRLPAEQLIGAALGRGLSGVVITEHERCWSEEELQALLAEAGNPPLRLFAGCEAHAMRDDGSRCDLLVFGIDSPPEGELHVDDLCRQVHARGGLVIAPHPFGLGAGIGEDIFSAPIDAIEIYNDRYRDGEAWRKAEQAGQQLGIAALGSSDAHALSRVGACCTEFAECPGSMAELIAAIREQRCLALARPPKSGILKTIRRVTGF